MLKNCHSRESENLEKRALKTRFLLEFIPALAWINFGGAEITLNPDFEHFHPII